MLRKSALIPIALLATVVLFAACSSSGTSSKGRTNEPTVDKAGKTIARYRDQLVEVIVDYKFASRSLGDDWIILNVAVTSSESKAIEVRRKHVLVRTPDGRKIPLPPYPDFIAAYPEVQSAAPVPQPENGRAGISSPMPASPASPASPEASASRSPRSLPGSLSQTFSDTPAPEGAEIQGHRWAVTGRSRMPGLRNEHPSWTRPQRGNVQSTPAGDSEPDFRLRAYSDSGWKSNRLAGTDFTWTADRQIPGTRTIPDETQLTVRNGGFDSPEVAAAVHPSGARSAAGEAVQAPGHERPAAPIQVDPAAGAAAGGRTGNDLAGGEADKGFTEPEAWDSGAWMKSGDLENTTFRESEFDSALLGKAGFMSEPHVSQGGRPGHAFDVTVERVFTSVMEHVRVADLERGRARFDIETDQGQKIRVRLTLDNNIVSARIDAPSEQVRDMLAGQAWQLNQRLETEGLIPDNIEFCFAGGEEQAAGDGERPGVGGGTMNSRMDEEIEKLTMVETEAYAFESWA